VTSQQFDSAQLISSLAPRKHIVGPMWPLGRMFDLTGSYHMCFEKNVALLPNMCSYRPYRQVFFGRNCIFFYKIHNKQIWSAWKQLFV